MPYQAHLLERHNVYSLEVFEVSKIISHLELAYEQTLNENVLVSIQMLRARQQEVRDSEVRLSEADVQELRTNPGLYNYTVTTWAFDYRDKEIS